ncbi:MAG: sigma-70 family RNA polymerase sigma factor [Bacteroidota bacterium]
MFHENSHLSVAGKTTKKDSVFSSSSDNENWKKFCAGDEAAFAYIYRKHVQALFNFGYQLNGDRDLTRDIIQDVFIKLRFSKSKVRIKSIKSYLFKCFYNEWIKCAKVSQHRTNLADERLAVTVSFEDKMVECQIGEERLAYLRKALETLTFRQRQAVTLFFYEGMGYEQIAEAMRLKNAKMARKVLYRAIDRLKPDKAVMDILYTFLL